MGHRDYLGDAHPGGQPVPVLQIPVNPSQRCTYLARNHRPLSVSLDAVDCSPTLVIPCRPSLGVAHAPRQSIRHPSQPWTLHGEGACAHHGDGYCGIPVCIRGTYNSRHRGSRF